MTVPAMDDRIVVEIARRGKLVVGEPYFTPGTPIVLDRKGLDGRASAGDLAVVATGRGRARSSGCSARPRGSRPCSRAARRARALRRPFEPYEPPAPALEGRTDLRELVTFTIDPDTAKDFDDAISVRARGRRRPRLGAHRRRLARSSPPARRSTAARRSAASRSTSRASSRRCCRPSSRTTSAGCGRTSTGSAVTVEVPFDARCSRASRVFYRSVIRSDARLTYGQARGDPRRARQRRVAAVGEALAARRPARGRAARPPLRPRRAAHRVARGDVRVRRQGRRRARLARDRADGARARRGADDPRERGRRRACSPGGGARRSTASTSGPTRRRSRLLLAKLADLERADAAGARRRHDARRRGRARRRESSERVTAYVEQSGRGREAFPSLVLRALKQARYDPRNLGHIGAREPRLLPLHVADPPLPRPRRATARCCASSASPTSRCAGGSRRRSPSTPPRASARRRRSSTAPTTICLAWLLERELFERGWDEPFDGEITGVIGSGLFVRFGDVFEGYVPARRLPGDYFELNDARHGARRPPRRRRVPARRPDRGARRGNRPRRRQGGALAGRACASPAATAPEPAPPRSPHGRRARS